MNYADTESLFDALDGRRLFARARYWCVEVYSVFEHDRKFWVQLLLRGAPNYHVTARIDPGQKPEDTAEQLADWLANPRRDHERIRWTG